MTREEAIERIKSRYDKWALDDKDLEAIQYIFPDLKESDDERIRKGLVQHLKELRSWKVGTGSPIKVPAHYDAWIAYLERQKEQHPLSTEETELNSIAFLEQMGYTCIPPRKEQKPIEFDNEFKNQVSHLLASVLNKEHDYTEGFVKYVSQSLLEYAKIELKPAKWNDADDKIQRNLMSLLSCMRGDRIAEATYKKYYPWLRDLPKRFNLKQSAEWSEEDRGMIQSIITGGCVDDKQEHWLRMLPERICQPKQEWSEEDEEMLNSCISSIEESKENRYAYRENDGDTSYDREIAWLKSLRPKPYKEIYHAAKHDLAIRFMNYLDENRPNGKMSLSNGECEDIDKAFIENDWAKILRYVEKYSPSWKPSEEQMRVFLKANPVNLMPDELGVYHSLYNDLKKL